MLSAPSPFEWKTASSSGKTEEEDDPEFDNAVESEKDAFQVWLRQGGAVDLSDRRYEAERQREDEKKRSAVHKKEESEISSFLAASSRLKVAPKEVVAYTGKEKDRTFDSVKTILKIRKRIRTEINGEGGEEINGEEQGKAQKRIRTEPSESTVEQPTAPSRSIALADYWSSSSESEEEEEEEDDAEKPVEVEKRLGGGGS